MSFLLIPAIDLREGRCVRLFQGDYEKETRYAGEPVEVAQRWAAAGAPMIHVVDLDGARTGKPANEETIFDICHAVSIPVEVSGGLRTIAALERAIDGGAARVQMGSVAVDNPELVAKAVDAFPERVVVAIDARNGQVMTKGWREATGRAASEFANSMVELGVRRLMFTDISRDGALIGPNVPAYAALVESVDVPVVASGGVTSPTHIQDLARAGCEGAVVGKALYEGMLDIEEALAVASAC
ncbi:MAG: 1-(5-phosphoribosyl)-5-[(5-phosphoribosylamino)methylideneamino]imidazole-4-carboxamide isomerase [Dehalococcoidia bacterium]